MSANLDRAKEIFWRYGSGNRFYMDRDGVREEYEELAVSPEQEAAWRAEFIEYWSTRLSTDDLTPLNNLLDAGAKEVLPRVLELADRGDDYARLWFAIAIWKLAGGLAQDRRAEALAESNRILAHLVANSSHISPLHRASVTRDMLAAFDASTAEEYVANYARRKLAERKRLGLYK